MSNYITIDNYYITINSGEKVYPLVKPIPAHKTSPSEIYEKIANQHPLYAGTVTIDSKKYLTKNYYEKVHMIEKALREYGKNKSVNYIGFMEMTKSGEPHCHLLCTGFQANFTKAFAHLGQHNKNNLSYQPVKSIEKYKEYIMKDYSPGDKYYYDK